jgi:hypothetical protein
MTTPKLNIGLALIAACGALWIAGCGGGGSDEKDKQLPAQQVSALQRELDVVERRLAFGDGACSDIQSRSKSDVETILTSIPASVDSDVRSALRQSFDRLWELSSSQCDTAKHQRTTPQTTPQVTPPPTPTQTQPQTHTETTPTQTQTQPQKPKKKDKGTGGGGADTGGDGGAG